MAYADQKQNRTVALGSVALVHVALGVVLVSGLAVKIIPDVETVLTTRNIPVIAPPPVDTPPPPERNTERVESPTPPINAPIPEVPTRSENETATTTIIYPPLPPTPPVTLDPPRPPVAPTPPANLSRGLQPRGNQGDWFPQDSYPAAARRAGAEGRVGVSVEVGANGRVTGCRVVTTSGNEDLDNATCRLATRNGRFTPALNAAGEAVPGTLTLRPVRWKLEE